MSSYACLASDESSDDSIDSNDFITDTGKIYPERLLPGAPTSGSERFTWQQKESFKTSLKPITTPDKDGWISVKSTAKKTGTSTSTTAIISRRRATDLEKTLNVNGLCDALMSPPSLNLQEDGWIYDKVIKGGDSRATDRPIARVGNNKEYTCIAIPNNAWNDQIQYYREYHI
jgi:hypothetical protein